MAKAQWQAKARIVEYDVISSEQYKISERGLVPLFLCLKLWEIKY